MELRKNEIKSGFFQGTPIFGKINNSIKFARCYRIGSMLYYSYLLYRKFRKDPHDGIYGIMRYLLYRKFRKAHIADTGPSQCYLLYRKFRKKCGCGALIRRSYLPYRKFRK